MLTLTINLAKVKDAYITKTTEGVDCVVIPATGVFIPSDQTKDKPVAALTIDVWRHMPNQFDRTATCRQKFAQAYYDSLTDAEKAALPIIGSGK